MRKAGVEQFACQTCARIEWFAFVREGDRFFCDGESIRRIRVEQWRINHFPKPK